MGAGCTHLTSSEASIAYKLWMIVRLPFMVFKHVDFFKWRSQKCIFLFFQSRLYKTVRIKKVFKMDRSFQQSLEQPQLSMGERLTGSAFKDRPK